MALTSSTSPSCRNCRNGRVNRSLAAAGPAAAGPIFASRESAAIWLGAGENVVTVGCVANAGDHCAALGQRGLRAELVIVAMKIVDVLRDNFPRRSPTLATRSPTMPAAYFSPRPQTVQ